MLRRLVFVLFCCGILPSGLSANSNTLQSILQQPDAPAGVVIEIATRDQAGLQWALPRAHTYIQQLRERFPKLPIVIVSHGREQFALQTNRQPQTARVHELTKLLKKDNVQLHVCGTHAAWRGVSAEDFPDYVDVSPAGPAQINDYLALDYVLIVIRKAE
ncbi:MAG: DsrE family protein [Gammaproteobacteria bacterium]|nr:DsrE family protein [Gammaproteobacteria bacterium]